MRNTMHKKIPKIYLYHSTEIAKARPHSQEWQTDTSVQKQWSMLWVILKQFLFLIPVKGMNQGLTSVP